MSLELIPTQKGGSKLVYMDNMYHKRRYSPDRTKIYWSCVRRPEGCKGSLVTTSDYKDPKRGTAHSHFAEDWMVDLAKARNSMKQRAKNGERSCLVYREICASASQDVLDFLPSAAVCSRTMRNARSTTHPRQPKKLSELTFSGPWLTTGGDSPRDFLQKDNGCGAPQRIVLFGTSAQVQHLASATEWYLDGNFAMAPDLFTQLYIIRAPLGESAVTVLYILLERKTQATYEEMLELLLELLDDSVFYLQLRGSSSTSSSQL